MNSARPDVSVVIVSFNTRDMLRDCLRHLQTSSEEVACETWMVDNNSRDGSPDMVQDEFPHIRLIRSETNLGFAAANNCAIKHATGRYIVLLNSDAFLSQGILRAAVDRMDQQPNVGLAGGLLTGTDGSWQPSARQFPSLLNDFLMLTGLAARFSSSRFFGRADRTWAPVEEPAEVDWVPGAFSIIRREALDSVGLFDERFFLYYEEVDLCKRIKQACYRVSYWPDLRVIHIGGESARTHKDKGISSSGTQLLLWRLRSQLLYYRKHHGRRACGSALLEGCWHLLRSLVNRFRSDAAANAKASESQLVVRMVRNAWRKTSGGRVCPSRPW